MSIINPPLYILSKQYLIPFNFYLWNRFTNTHQMFLIGLCRRMTLILIISQRLSFFREQPASSTAVELLIAMACVRQAKKKEHFIMFLK